MQFFCRTKTLNYVNKIFAFIRILYEFCLTIGYEHYTNKLRQNDGKGTHAFEKLRPIVNAQS